MADDFTGELNESRISIKIEKNVGNAKEKLELPFNILVPMEIPGERPKEDIADRERVAINKNNFNDVMKKSNVGLNNLVVDSMLPGGGELKVKLKFDGMQSFDPEEIVKQVPDLRRILELRNLLNDFKSRVLTDKGEMNKLQTMLGALAKSKPDYAKLKDEVDKQRAAEVEKQRAAEIEKQKQERKGS